MKDVVSISYAESYLLFIIIGGSIYIGTLISSI